MNISYKFLALVGVRIFCYTFCCEFFNYIYDILHDLLEGVCNMAMSGTIVELCKYSHTNLNLINNRVECFDFRNHSNRPIPICQRTLDRKDLGISASEMMYFVM